MLRWNFQNLFCFLQFLCSTCFLSLQKHTRDRRTSFITNLERMHSTARHTTMKVHTGDLQKFGTQQQLKHFCVE